MLDASQGFTGEDKRIAARVMEVGRGLVVVANKWDLIEERDRSFKELTELLSPYARAPVLRTSAIGGTGVHRLPAVLSQVHERWMRRAPTARVNEVVAAAQAEQQAPGGIRYRYATQVAAGPPRFVLFGGGPPGGELPAVPGGTPAPSASTSRAYRSASGSARAAAAPASAARPAPLDLTGRLAAARAVAQLG